LGPHPPRPGPLRGDREGASRTGVRGSELGIEEAEAARVEDLGGVEEAISAALAAQRSWGTLGMEKRAMVLRRVARMLAGHRAELLEVMASETGKTFEQGDPEVSEAI